MRIKMSGAYTPEEFLDALKRIVDTLVDHGMDQIRGINLYINLYKGDYFLDIADQETGQPFQVLEHKGHKFDYWRRPIPDVEPGFEMKSSFKR